MEVPFWVKTGHNTQPRMMPALHDKAEVNCAASTLNVSRYMQDTVERHPCRHCC